MNPVWHHAYLSLGSNENPKHYLSAAIEALKAQFGDVVLSPFAGIGSEGYVALEKGRRFVGTELKQSYYEQAARNLAPLNLAALK